ncbi:MAG: hypothetical protein QOE93_717 [Actinomycetota bacterium]|nr:hypothetical protein [Actinomycetota bacterium]
MLRAMDDATLVSRAVGGDRDAFGDIYDRYAGAVLDLCTAVLRNADEAADATLDSFLRAARELVNLRDRSQLRLWLLAVARYEATSRVQRRRRDGLPELSGTVPGGMASADADVDDPRRLVWDPAEALSERDRAILHLHLRHELEGEELGAVIGLRAAAAEGRAEHLRRLAEMSVGALLLSRADPGEATACPNLAQILHGWDGRFTPAIGARVHRHARWCVACRERRTMLLERLRAMASLPFLPPPEWLRREVLLRMELAVSSRLLPGWQEGGFPPGVGGNVRRPSGIGRVIGTLVAAMILGVGAVGVLLNLRDDDGGGDRAAINAVGRTVPLPPTSLTSLPGVATVPVSTTTPAATTSAPPTTAATSPTTVGAPPVITVAPTTPPPPPPDRDGPGVSFGADVASAYVYGCPYSSTSVTADVADPSGVAGVALYVVGPDGVEESVQMSPGGGGWHATMGNFGTPGQALFWVEAVDSLGNRTRAADQSFAVYACE